jgi:hypothetical protein
LPTAYKGDAEVKAHDWCETTTGMVSGLTVEQFRDPL